MTPESEAIADVVDRYPEEIRARLLDAMKRIAAAYEETAEKQEPVGASNVIPLNGRRSSRQGFRASRRRPTNLD